jgi:hypothetical protein
LFEKPGVSVVHRSMQRAGLTAITNLLSVYHNLNRIEVPIDREICPYIPRFVDIME